MLVHIGQMLTTATPVQWRAPKNGANFCRLLMAASYYPEDVAKRSTRVTTSVRLPESEHEQVKFIARLWNAFDQASGRQRNRKWKPASVIAQLVSVGLNGIGSQIGGWPEGKGEEDALVQHASEVMKRVEQKKK